MFIQSNKVQKWYKKNYVVTIINFVVHYIILLGFLTGLIFINSGSGSGFVDYFKNGENVRKTIYLALFTLMTCATIYIYLYCEFRDFLISAKNIALIFVVFDFSYILTFVLGNYVSVYSRPVALCALLLLLLVNKRTAMFMNYVYAVFVFLVDMLTNQPLSIIDATTSLLIASTVNILAIYLVDGIGSRIKIFAMGFIISAPIMVVGLVLELTVKSTVGNVLLVLAHGLTGGMLSVVILMAILPVFEWMFNVLTNYRLAEITDHKSKLVRAMAEKASGTFNHSTQVAHIAESCATAIGENSLLARAAAYYHDIGKLKQPLYFTENQSKEKGAYNPHEDLTPELSTEIIRSHTKDGYELIKKYHLPLFLADVALEHHGTLLIQYFYKVATDYADGAEVDKARFCYPGPKPSSKIAAIIMLADGCEAAVRARKERTREAVENVVNSIVKDRMEANQFSNCDITMKEIDLIRQSIINTLSGVYHDRINYPDLNEKRTNAFAAKSSNAKLGKKSKLNDKGGQNA